jgi:hypothetical protein
MGMQCVYYQGGNNLLDEFQESEGLTADVEA